MIRAVVAEARVFNSWLDINEGVKTAITALTGEQLAQRLVPGLRSVAEISEHIVYGRALHLHRVYGDTVAELVPMIAWNEPATPPRSAADIVEGLDLTWQVLKAILLRGTPTSELSDEETSQLQIIWGLLDHDLPHAGEISILLGAYGLPGVEI